MGLIDKLRHYQHKAGIAAIATGSLLLAGCETVPDGYVLHHVGKPTVPYSSSNNETSSGDYLLGSLIFGGAALNQNLTPQQSAAFSTLGQVAETGAIIQGQREAAREGKSQVNVYNNSEPSKDNSEPSDNHPIKKLSNVIFTCNYWKDLNNNSYSDPDEFVGIKSTFSTNETIGVMILNSHQIRFSTCLKIVNLTKLDYARRQFRITGLRVPMKEIFEEIYGVRITSDRDGEGLFGVKFDKGHFTPGSHEGSFYIDNEQIGKSIEFEVK